MDNYSFWEEDAFLQPADVTIAGAGFAGLWTAFFLARKAPSLRIRILERSLIPSGASTRNAGFACFGSLTELIADAASFGYPAMQKMVSMRWEGLQFLTSEFQEEEIDYFQKGGSELIPSGRFENQAELREQINRINLLLKEVVGPDSVFTNEPLKLSAFGFGNTSYLVGNELEGQLHSGKLVKALISRLRKMNVDILFGVEVMKYTSNQNSVSIQTTLGTLSSGQFIICNNSFAPQLSDQLNIIPARGQLLLTGPVSNLKFEGCFHADEGFYYFRNLGDRVLLGGARNKAFSEEKTRDTVVTDTIQQELERYLRTVVLPGSSVEIERRWSGIMGMSATRHPVVKELEPHVFAAVGMGGIGVAVGPVTGRQAAERIIGSR